MLLPASSMDIEFLKLRTVQVVKNKYVRLTLLCQQRTIFKACKKGNNVRGVRSRKKLLNSTRRNARKTWTWHELEFCWPTRSESEPENFWKNRTSPEPEPDPEIYQQNANSIQTQILATFGK